MVFRGYALFILFHRTSGKALIRFDGVVLGQTGRAVDSESWWFLHLPAYLIVGWREKLILPSSD